MFDFSLQPLTDSYFRLLCGFRFGVLVLIWGLVCYLGAFVVFVCFKDRVLFPVSFRLPWNLLGSWVFELLILLSPPWITDMQHHHRFFFMFYILLCMYVYERVCVVYTQECGGVHICAHKCRPEEEGQVSCSITLCPIQSHTESGANLTANKHQQSSCLCSHPQCCSYMHVLMQAQDFYVGSGDSNSSPHACTTNTVTH